MHSVTLNIYIVLILISPAFAFPLKASRVADGVINLTNIRLNSTLPLNGPWQYYYGDFLSANAMQQLPENQKRYVTVPSRWNNTRKYPEKLSNLGCT